MAASSTKGTNGGDSDRSRRFVSLKRRFWRKLIILRLGENRYVRQQLGWSVQSAVVGPHKSWTEHP